MRRATCTVHTNHNVRRISIHALLAESDGGDLHYLIPSKDFYPRSPCGERPATICNIYAASYFYPRSPCGERPLNLLNPRPARLFLSTLSLRRATRDNRYRRRVFEFLSTLSLRRATGVTTSQQMIEEISIHALLAESDGIPGGGTGGVDAFLSTLSLRRATLAA